MCIEWPVPFHSEVPITAYKVMIRDLKKKNTHKGDLEIPILSLFAENEYLLGKQYDAESPRNTNDVEFSFSYEKGFHAYETKEDAMWHLQHCITYVKRKDAVFFSKHALAYHKCEIGYCVVEVELSNLTFKGEELPPIGNMNDLFGPNFSIYVANTCKFVRIIGEC